MDLDEKILLSYLSGECTERQLEEIGKWLDESPDNASRLFGLKLALELPQRERFEDGALIAAAEKNVMERIARREDALRRDAGRLRRRGRILRLAWAAAAAAVIIAGIFLFRDDFRANDMVRIAVAPDGDVREISLPDGSRVWLNQASRIEYASDFGHSARSLYLDGECYFEVARDESSPFVVESPAMRVTVLGTTFNMSSRVADTTAAVTLITGSVEVRGNRGGGQIVLTPGQKAQIDIVSKHMTVSTVDAKLDAVWHDNLIPFRNASIIDIAKSLEQLYDVKISLARDLDPDRRYSGVIHRQNSISEVLDLLKNTIPISYETAGNTITISGFSD